MLAGEDMADLPFRPLLDEGDHADIRVDREYAAEHHTARGTRLPSDGLGRDRIVRPRDRRPAVIDVGILRPLVALVTRHERTPGPVWLSILNGPWRPPVRRHYRRAQSQSRSVERVRNRTVR